MGSSFPRAEFFFRPTKIGYSYTQEAELEEEAVKWKFLKNKNIDFSGESDIWNSLGKTRYVTFSVEANSCIAMQRYWGETNFHDGTPRLGTRYLTGYYCFNGQQNLEKDRVEQITDAITVRFED